MENILITTSSFGKDDLSPLNDLNKMKGINIVTNPYERKLTEDEVSRLIEELKPIGMIAGVEPLTRNVLIKAKGLKVISRCGIGLDSVDLDAANELGIIVTNTPDAPTIPVAELTLGMILCLLRQLHTADASIRRGQWERPMGLLLYGKTVGIIGCGRIGSYLAKLLHAFNCTLLGYDPNIKQHELYEMVTLNDLLQRSDIISIHIPYSHENHHLIGVQELSITKENAILVNAARGGLVDENALYEYLQSGHLLGAALDCHEVEPCCSSKFVNMPNVLLTPHIGSYAREARVIMEMQAADNLIKELKKIGDI